MTVMPRADEAAEAEERRVLDSWAEFDEACWLELASTSAVSCTEPATTLTATEFGLTPRPLAMLA